MRKPQRKPGHGRASAEGQATKGCPDCHGFEPDQEHEGRIDRIERIHRRPGVRAEQSEADAPLRFRDTGDFETVSDAMKRLRGSK